MKKDILVFLLIFIIASVFWRGAFFNFFAQDDFILTLAFSQNDLVADLVHVFGKPEVTHWRPMHNFYFFVAGNLFGKSHFLYHSLTIFLHVSTGFLIYKILVKIWKNFNLALVTSLIYVIHPAHFVAMYWISGSAVNIGFFFLLLAFYIYLKGQKIFSLLLYVLALLGSEAMATGAPLFALSLHLGKKVKLDKKFLPAILLATFVFSAVKLATTSAAALEIYRLEISTRVLSAIYYYSLRILGFAEVSGDFALSIMLLIFLLLVAWKVLTYIRGDRKKLLLPLSGLAGLFPFVLLPAHLSPHYMVLPIFGFSQFLALGICRFSKALMIGGFLLFALISFQNIQTIEKNNWVVKRSDLAKKYFQAIDDSGIPNGSTIIFADSDISSSEEAYVTLGKGLGVDFWFGDKNYTYCFERFDSCSDLTSEKYQIR